MSVIVTGTDMPKTCIDCEYPNCDYYKAEWCRHDDYTINYKNSRGISCPLKSIDGLIEKVEQLKKSCATDSYGKCMANAISRVEKLIKEYCEVSDADT